MQAGHLNGGCIGGIGLVAGNLETVLGGVKATLAGQLHVDEALVDVVDLQLLLHILVHVIHTAVNGGLAHLVQSTVHLLGQLVGVAGVQVLTVAGVFLGLDGTHTDQAATGDGAVVHVGDRAFHHVDVGQFSACAVSSSHAVAGNGGGAVVILHLVSMGGHLGLQMAACAAGSHDNCRGLDDHKLTGTGVDSSTTHALAVLGQNIDHHGTGQNGGAGLLQLSSQLGLDVQTVEANGGAGISAAGTGVQVLAVMPLQVVELFQIVQSPVLALPQAVDDVFVGQIGLVIVTTVRDLRRLDGIVDGLQTAAGTQRVDQVDAAAGRTGPLGIRLVQNDHIQAVLTGLQGSADTGGAGTADHDIAAILLCILLPISHNQRPPFFSAAFQS